MPLLPMTTPSMAAIAVALMITGCSGGSSSGTQAASSSSASTSSSSGGGTSGGGSSGGGTAPPTATTSLPAGSLGCAAPQLTAGSGTSSSSSLGITVSGNDLTQTFTSGSSFNVKFAASAGSADVIAWQILDYTGAALASGSINVPQGSTTATVPCTSTLAGYFAATAKLQNSGATQSKLGSRPAGYASFGVLPDVADLVPAMNGALDLHRIGLQGANYVESGVCCSGNGLQPVNENLGSTWVLDQRAQLTTEPKNAGQYNPASYPLDPGLKQGTLARIVSMNGLPHWASTAPSASSVGTYPPKSFSAFQSYSALVGEESALVHAKYIPNQQKNYYQVTWEPDPGPPTQWMGTDAQFVSLYKAAWNGVHSSDPDAMVMGPTTQGPVTCGQWLTRLAPLGFTKYLDAVACHGYYTLGASSAKPPEPADLPGQIQGLRKAMLSVLPAGTKLFVTETGISYPEGAQYSASYPTTEVLTEHAEAVVRTHLIMLGEGVDTSFLFYSADFQQNVGFGMYFNLSMQVSANNFNSPNISPKPAALAVAAATRLVDGSRSLGALTNLPSGGYGYSFLLNDKSHAMTALWAHDDSFNASLSYPLQVDSPGASGTAIVFDAMGNAKSAPYTNGVLQVTLSEMPVYVMSSNVSVLESQTRAPEGYSTQF
jgi:hypothetical protein